MEEIHNFIDIIANTSIIRIDSNKLKQQARDMKTPEELYQLIIYYLRSDGHAKFFTQEFMLEMINPDKEMKIISDKRPKIKINNETLIITYPRDIYDNDFLIPLAFEDYYQELKEILNIYNIMTIIVDLSECHGGSFDFAFLFVKFLFQYRKSLKGIAYFVYKHSIKDISKVRNAIVTTKIPKINLKYLENIKIKLGINSHSASELLAIIMMCLSEKYSVKYIGGDTDGIYNTSTIMLNPFLGYILMMSDSLIMSHNGFISRGSLRIKELNNRIKLDRRQY